MRFVNKIKNYQKDQTLQFPVFKNQGCRPIESAGILVKSNRKGDRRCLISMGGAKQQAETVV